MRRHKIVFSVLVVLLAGLAGALVAALVFWPSDRSAPYNADRTPASHALSDGPHGSSGPHGPLTEEDVAAACGVCGAMHPGVDLLHARYEDRGPAVVRSLAALSRSVGELGRQIAEAAALHSRFEEIPDPAQEAGQAPDQATGKPPRSRVEHLAVRLHHLDTAARGEPGFGTDGRTSASSQVLRAPVSHRLPD
ncbi:hypothetical protein [Streptomyces sp. NBC_00687]|uniref:hypothetical protein n=1 Tax=Streptomyces sp. NBC_00687 TaxID=2975807 RepID=UPI0022575466|nr:hypothetical protein [Streptomyces sp. NBC_00687]MCX4920027.1 hypothetical protein [Streptomyces sp. NBC_00687]